MLRQEQNIGRKSIPGVSRAVRYETNEAAPWIIHGEVSYLWHELSGWSIFYQYLTRQSAGG